MKIWPKKQLRFLHLSFFPIQGTLISSLRDKVKSNRKTIIAQDSLLKPAMVGFKWAEFGSNRQMYAYKDIQAKSRFFNNRNILQERRFKVHFLKQKNFIDALPIKVLGLMSQGGFIINYNYLLSSLVQVFTDVLSTQV